MDSGGSNNPNGYQGDGDNSGGCLAYNSYYYRREGGASDRPSVFAMLGEPIIIEIVKEEELVVANQSMIEAIVEVLLATADTWIGKVIGEIVVPIMVGLLVV